MIPNSIRWRLPLSYAAIAMLTALALGAVLLTILRSYYYRQELDYLVGNANAIGVEVDRLLEYDLPLDAFRSQLAGFAFLSQTRVRLLSPNGEVIADSGALNQLGNEGAVLVEASAGDNAAPGNTGDPTASEPTGKGSSYRSAIVIVNRVLTGELSEQVMITRTETLGVQTVVAAQQTVQRRLVSQLPIKGTPYGFGLGPGVTTSENRSNVVVKQAIPDRAGNLQGYVELSQGPAYGRGILNRVAWGWSVASGLAVLLAATVGWMASRGLSGPLIALTDVTTRMEAGDLSARAKENRRDELGLLSRSFNSMADRVEGTILTLRRFVADAAHELHTPLTALGTDLELLGQEVESKAQEDRVRRAQTQVNRLEALTEGLLDLSRLETRGLAPVRKKVDLNQLVQQSAEISASRAEQAGLAFIFEPDEREIIVEGDEGLLLRALGNLLDNAVKFTPEGGQVRLATQTEGKWASVIVSDSGIGIPDEDIEGLFGRFHRGRNATNFPGSGLGLAIVRAIAEGAGGKIIGESSAEGSCFTLQLPLPDG